MQREIYAYDSSLLWKIENFSLQKGKLESPHFYSFKENWCIEILLKDNSLGADEIQIGFRQLTYNNVYTNYSCAILNSEGSLFNLSEQKGLANNCTWILSYDEIFNASNFPKDVVIINARVWCDITSFVPPNELALTSLFSHADFEQYREVIKETFLWRETYPISNFGVTHIKPMLRDKVLKLTLSQYLQTLIVKINIPANAGFSKFNIYLFKEKENYLQFKEDTFKTDTSSYIFYLNLDPFYNVYDFTRHNDLWLIFSYTYCDSRMEETCANNMNQGDIQNPKMKICSSTVSVEPKSRQTLPANTPNTIFQDLRSMYEEGFLSDFSLRVQDRTFPVHKNILGARSSVFRAMFTSDVKEKISGYVDIPDVDADTIQRMLKFVYWNELDKNLQEESACSLYSAADKYALELLKQRCSSHLRANLSLTSVLGVLVLSDTHQDEVLKAAALDFISRNDKEIIGTERWTKFMEEHGPLALEVLQQLYLKKMAV